MQQIIKLTWGMWLLCWATAAIAGSAVTFDQDLAHVAPAAIVLTVVFSLLGGVANTLQKLARVDAPPVRSVPLEVAKDLVVGVVAGLAAFFVSEWMEWRWALEALAITLAGYGGSRVLDAVLNRGLREVDRGSA
ncbi:MULTISPECIES: phage holin family protein [Pandoraea]|uniref:Phage holin family protein n=1 Tax=Pandoraea commovens TaxID=2508289 RepID=A0ABY5QI50_9BURK|nr:phage holin family protein [Pandoraea commovens]UVA80481.1 phage holin family protein [Pandoraea commovens]